MYISINSNFFSLRQATKINKIRIQRKTRSKNTELKYFRHTFATYFDRKNLFGKKCQKITKNCVKERKSRCKKYDATNANVRLSHPVFNPLFGNNSTRFIEAAGVTLIAICQGSFITRAARDISVSRENASVCLFIANGKYIYSIPSSYIATTFAECVPQITVEPVITFGKKQTRILIGTQLKFIGLHAIQFIVSGPSALAFILIPMTAQSRN